MSRVRVRAIHEFVIDLPLDQEEAYACAVGDDEGRLLEQKDSWRDDPYAMLECWYDDEQGTFEITLAKEE